MKWGLYSPNTWSHTKCKRSLYMKSIFNPMPSLSWWHNIANLCFWKIPAICCSRSRVLHLNRWMHPHPKAKIKEIGLTWWEAHSTLYKVRDLVDLTFNHLTQVGQVKLFHERWAVSGITWTPNTNICALIPNFINVHGFRVHKLNPTLH